jgi:hypothetical protein
MAKRGVHIDTTLVDLVAAVTAQDAAALVALWPRLAGVLDHTTGGDRPEILAAGSLLARAGYAGIVTQGALAQLAAGHLASPLAAPELLATIASAVDPETELAQLAEWAGSLPQPALTAAQMQFLAKEIVNFSGARIAALRFAQSSVSY